MTAGCSRCRILRRFLGAAIPLIGLIGLRPEPARALAALMPAPDRIATAIVGIGAAVFLMRYIRWRQDAARR
jgi:hypothetical protein